jgi:hypothetical protein
MTISKKMSKLKIRSDKKAHHHQWGYGFALGFSRSRPSEPCRARNLANHAGVKNHGLYPSPSRDHGGDGRQAAGMLRRHKRVEVAHPHMGGAQASVNETLATAARAK